MAVPPSSIPGDLVRAATDVHGEPGRAWATRLPKLVADCGRAWSLTVGAPLPRLSYSYVVTAVCADGTPAVLKVCFPDREFFTEVAALRLHDGRGAVRLLAADLARGALLLERLEPGTPLSAMADDVEATRIAAVVMRQLWRPVPPDHSFPSVADWVAGMAARAPRVLGSGCPFPGRWIDRAVGLCAELSADHAEPVVLHGDLHHGNVVAARRAPWLAIDPKGVVGEPAAEVGPLLLNRLPEPRRRPEIGQLLARRVDQLAAGLGLDRGRLRAWGIVRAVLSAFWSAEDHGHGWESAIACAELLTTPIPWCPVTPRLTSGGVDDG